MKTLALFAMLCASPVGAADSESTSAKFSLVAHSQDSEVLLITGLKREEPIRVPTDTRALIVPVYLRPINPDEITVTITTRDGRKWRAKWEEVK